MPAEPQSKTNEEFGLFVQRLMQFMNLWTVYKDFLSGRYVPSVGGSVPLQEWSFVDMGPTLMFVLYGFFYSLVEDSDSAINGFRIWRRRFPEEEPAIAAVESQVSPFLEDLRVFRNRLAFHGSLSRSRQARGLDLFANYSGDRILAAMKNFKSLSAALLAKENAAQGLRGSDATETRAWIDAVAQRARRAHGSA